MEHYLVTGAGSEIGLELILTLLKEGKRVYACDIEKNKTKILERTEAFRAEGLLEVYWFDMNEDEQTEAFWKNLENREVKIKNVINIAGINLLTEFFSWERAGLNRVFELNFISTVLFAKRAAQHMIQNRIAGNILFMASQNGMVVSKHRVPYCTSKAMLVQMTKALALELTEFDIRVNCISPTYVLTKDNEKLLKSPYFQNMELPKIPAGRYAVPEDIVRAVRFLTDAGTTMINGHNLVIDGGWTLQ